MVLHGSSTLKWAQTQLCSWVQQLRRLSTFSPVQSSFELSLGKTSSDAGGRATYFATSLHQVSSVTEVWYPGIPVYFSYYMTDTW